MNVINIIDIMDGLAGSTVIIASLSFFLVTSPENLLINLLAISMAGAILGFLPYNFSKKRKIFMGDTGSLLLGYLLAILSLNIHYPNMHANIIAPILILGVPLYDTLFVMLIRYHKGISPFLGSKDHFAMRLERSGLTKKQIIYMTSVASLILSFLAWQIMQVDFFTSSITFIFVILVSSILGVFLSRIEMVSQ